MPLSGNAWPIRWGQMKVVPERLLQASLAVVSDPYRSTCVSAKTDADGSFTRMLIIGDAMPPSTTDAEPPEVNLWLRRTDTGQIFASWVGQAREWPVVEHAG